MFPGQKRRMLAALGVSKARRSDFINQWSMVLDEITQPSTDSEGPVAEP